jgi:hypothetical protein
VPRLVIEVASSRTPDVSGDQGQNRTADARRGSSDIVEIRRRTVNGLTSERSGGD